MKKLFSVVAVLLFGFLQNFLLSQEVKYAELSTITQRGQCTSYIASDGAIYKIGDKLKIGFPSSNKTFAFITEGDGLLLPVTPLLATSSGQQVEIKKMYIFGNKKMGYYISIRTTGVVGFVNYQIQFENALTTGELKGFGKTSDEALNELKKAKDKLDLGLITQGEFDKLKQELSKYIK